MAQECRLIEPFMWRRRPQIVLLLRFRLLRKAVSNSPQAVEEDLVNPSSADALSRTNVPQRVIVLESRAEDAALARIQSVKLPAKIQPPD
jgi:hypothetical protein